MEVVDLKIKFNLKIFISLIAIISITSMLIVGVNFKIQDDYLKEYYLGKTRVQSYDISVSIEQTMSAMTSGVNDLKVMLGQNRDIDYIVNDYFDKNSHVEGLYIYDDNNTLRYYFDKSSNRFNVIRNSNEKNVIGLPKWWDSTDRKDYIYHSKITLKDDEVNYNISLIVNISDILIDITEQHPNYIVIDPYYNIVNSNSEENQVLKIDQKTQRMVNGYFEQGLSTDGFYSYGTLEVEYMDLYYVYSIDSSEYRASTRSFIVKNIGIVMFSISIGLLIGWRMIKMIHREILVAIVDKRYQSSEFAILDKKLNVAISWIEDVMGHYYELEHLKEELVEIVDNIPKEGESHVKKDIKKTTKKLGKRD